MDKRGFGNGSTAFDELMGVKTYKCLSCWKDSSIKKWKQDGFECPKCGHIYDLHCELIAQDFE